MKKIWKSVLLITVILILAGVVCIGVSYFMGGTVDSLYQNKNAQPVLDMFSLDNIVYNLASFFGF